jgi:hypothetical protein
VPADKRGAAPATPTAAPLPGQDRATVEIRDLGVFPPAPPATPFTIEVSRAVRGAVAPGSRITLFQPGGTVELPALQDGGPTRTVTYQDDDDQPLAVGPQTLLLFLKRQADGSFVAVGGPQGRYAVDAAGRLQPAAADSRVGRALRGMPVDAAAARLSAPPG